MIILGLDVATRTGFAFSAGRDRHQIISGSFSGKVKVPENMKHLKTFLVSNELEQLTHKLIKDHDRPDLCFIEAPLSGSNVNPATLCITNQFFGSVKAVVRGYGIPVEQVASATWREKMYGFGRRKGWQSHDWKIHARFQCEDVLGHPVKNADEAEAVMISQYGFYTQAFRSMAA